MRQFFFFFAALFAFVTSDCYAFEWKAKWIGAPWDGETFDKEKVFPAPILRKSITADKSVTSATAYVTGVGFFEFFINGQKVGDEVLSPNETSYGHRDNLNVEPIPMSDQYWRGFRVLYLTYDVKPYLKKGENELSAIVGNGFFSTESKRWVAPYGTPRFICQIEIVYSDGSKQTVVSDESWEVKESPIVQNDMYLGEVYDARKESQSDWVPAALKKAPDGVLMPQDGPADRVMEVLKPKSIVKLADGRFEVDFGDYVSGWVRLNDIDIPAGSSIEIDHPIETEGNGVYRFISAGVPVKSYAPRFTWWVFNKVIVSGWKGELRSSDIQAEVVHSDVREYAHFECSNPLINKIVSIWKRTQTDNMHLGVATDCPHREKGPYTGDGEVSSVAVMHTYDVNAFYRKWLHDMSDCQDTKTGYVPNGAPWHPGCGGGVAWGAAMCIIPWEHYLHYGDIAVLEENYFPMTEQLRHMLSWRLEDGTMFQQMTGGRDKPIYWMNLGEWCPPYGLPSENLVHTWYLWRCASYTAYAAEALGKAEDCRRYRALADDVAAAFHKKFYDDKTGSYGAGSGILDSSGYGTGDGKGTGDGSNIFAMAMGVPEQYRDKVVDAVRAELKANDGHLNTGIYGTSLFFEALCDYGLEEEAYVAMTKRDFPSFGWWIEQGAQTTWEQWNGEASRNHPMFGGALVWLYRKLCGVQADPLQPGYRHSVIRPTPVGDLTWAEYSTDTSFGRLSVRWDISAKSVFRLKVVVPSGTTASVYLPDGSSEIVLAPGRHSLRCVL